ncbi:MAG: family 1 glycosylhydrolase, partial [Actinomycetota bacterium]|nr:family 1 glycosylhydrolase [Actinomycetota bacterium]
MKQDPGTGIKNDISSQKANFSPRFPHDFIIGTATSAFQIEGEGNTEWQGFRGRDGTFLGKSIDHYARFKEDMEYILFLGNSYRFSMDWSKLQKNPFSELDEDALKHYKYIFETLRKNNKKVCLVLNHFSNPKWFILKGGWAAKTSVNYYLDYAKKVMDAFHEHIDIMNTFNEPNGYAFLMHIVPEFPGSRFSLLKWHRTLQNMSQSHERIYDYIKEKYPEILVGISHAYMYIEPLSEKSIYQKMIIKIADKIQNEGVHERFTRNGKFDYIGFSYYGRLLIGK